MKPRLYDEKDLVTVDGRTRVRVKGGVGGGAIERDSLRELAHQDSRARRQRTENGREPVANPASSPYKSKWEENFAKVLDLELKAGAIAGWLYEPFSFRLASGKRYRVDFVTWGPNGTECIEVKGRWIKNRRDGMTHLRWAAQRFPFFTWRLVWMEGHGFNGIYVTT